MTKLYFTELACNGWGSALTLMIQNLLCLYGWTMLAFTLPAGEQTERGRTKAKKFWRDSNHPKLNRATDIVTRLVKQMGLEKGSRVLLLGDSTTSHCIDRQHGWHNNRHVYSYEARNTMQQDVLTATGIEVHHFGVSTTSFEGYDNFFVWLENAVERNKDDTPYDAILLIGGWNQTLGGWNRIANSKQEMVTYLEPILTAFTDACEAALV